MLEAIFVVGTGRSGTHFTTRVMAGFENIFDPLQGRENSAILRDIARAAIFHHGLSKAVSKYYRDFSQNRPPQKILLDQHHPNLFHIVEIMVKFPNYVFLYPKRPLAQIVSSMLNHKGVLAWYDFARSYDIPYPNQFLGITHRAQLDELPLHVLCAMRVIAHEAALAQVLHQNPKNIKVIEYEALVMDQEKELSRVFSAEELHALGEFRVVEKPNATSLVKYKLDLSKQQLFDIKNLAAKSGFW